MTHHWAIDDHVSIRQYEALHKACQICSVTQILKNARVKKMLSKPELLSISHA